MPPVLPPKPPLRSPHLLRATLKPATCPQNLNGKQTCSAALSDPCLSVPLSWTLPGVRQQLFPSPRPSTRNADFRNCRSRADAVEEAGCTNSDVLAHFRGLWASYTRVLAVDLVLAKE